MKLVRDFDVNHAGNSKATSARRPHASNRMNSSLAKQKKSQSVKTPPAARRNANDF